MTQSDDTKVLFNDNCPVCSFEINHYADYAKKQGLPIQFDDLNGPDRAAWGLDEATAARRLYVLHKGELTSGIPAYLVLWQELPRYRWLAKVVGLPGIQQAASAIYDYVLAPVIYRRHWRRIARGVSQSG